MPRRIFSFCSCERSLTPPSGVNRLGRCWTRFHTAADGFAERTVSLDSEAAALND